MTCGLLTAKKPTVAAGTAPSAEGPLCAKKRALWGMGFSKRKVSSGIAQPLTEEPTMSHSQLPFDLRALSRRF